MADISKEIQNFRSARRGKDVRGSMISLAEKVNKESTDAKTAAAKSASDAGTAASNASYAVTQANTAAQNANTAAQNIQTKADRGDFTGTIRIGEVTTGEPGSDASVNNSGTDKDAVIDLTIPQGYQGVSMRMAGAWVVGKEYVNNTSYIDLVTYNGGTYGCKQTHTASEETAPPFEGNEYWQVIAKKGDTGGIENIDTTPIEFEEAEERENIESGDPLPKGLGKIRKWFSDLRQAAFMNVVNGVTQSVAGQAVLDAAVGKYLDEKKLDISRIVANRNITELGFAMDGKTAADWLNELNGKFAVTIIEGDLFEYAELLPVGFYTFGANANTTNVPDSPSAGCIIKRTSSHISIILVAYGTGKYYCVEYGGNWRKWNKLVLDSDLEVISFSQEIIADTATALSSAPQSKQYIPVVTTVSGTPRYAGSFCFTSGSWYFTANNTQRYGFAFYKYPV